MEDSLRRKIRQLGLDRQGVMTSTQKALAAMKNLKPKTPESAITILSTKIAGTSHIKGFSQIVDELQIGMLLTLQRDKDNAYDTRAVVVLDPKNRKLGFLPKEDNETASNLMDAGKSLFAQVVNIDTKPRWADISITVYMKER